jgi:hypothetical protein
VHGPEGGARDIAGVMLAAAFLALAALAGLVALAGRGADLRSVRRRAARSGRLPSLGWHTADATRGPPALA